MDSLLDVLWGLKTEAVFDVWTIEHLLSGISIGSLVSRRDTNFLGTLFGERSGSSLVKADIVAVLLLAFAWETVEHYLETGLAGAAVEFWFQGVEMWANRIIADPLTLVAGYAIARRVPTVVSAARLCSIGWLSVHILVFPHSMYLHELV